MESNNELEARARRIKLLLMDCDGVLTDGRLFFSKNGEELKAFNVRDGQGIVNWHLAGFSSGIISGRRSEGILDARAQDLNMSYVRAGSRDKLNDLAEILEDGNYTSDEAAFIGDDVSDLGIMKQVGLAIAVADAVEEVRKAANYVTRAKGGCGAVREVIDLLLELRIGETHPT